MNSEWGPRNRVDNEIKPSTLSSWSMHSNRSDNKQTKGWIYDVSCSCECNEGNWSTLIGLGATEVLFSIK